MWIWVVSNIAGSLLGAASTTWIKDTKLGVWGYSKFEDIADWAKDRYGIDILDKEDIAWRTQYPNIAKRIDDLEQRLHKIEQEEELSDNLLSLSFDLFLKSINISFLCSRGVLKVSAITFVVISSGVGPSPPVVIRISDLLDASSIASSNLAGLSPITVCLKCGIPKIANCSAIH